MGRKKGVEGFRYLCTCISQRCIQQVHCLDGLAACIAWLLALACLIAGIGLHADEATMKGQFGLQDTKNLSQI
eukprot:4572846-Amphidinium_carterae.1